MTKLYIPSSHNSIFGQIEREFDSVESLEEADVVMLWNDVNSFERGLIDLAHAMNKKVVVLQHGRKGTSRYYPPFNEKIRADAILVWGEYDKRSLLAVGQDAQKIWVVGSPILQSLPKRKEHDGVNIVFCPEHWDKEVEENRQVRDCLRGLQDKHKSIKITTKIIEGHNPNDYDNPVQTNRNDNEHLRVCKEILSTADLVVGISESTFELMAQAMDVPTVIMSDWTPKACNGDERYKKYKRVVSEGSAKVHIEGLEETVIFHLENPDTLQEERRLAAIDEGGLGLDTMKLIEQCLKKI